MSSLRVTLALVLAGCAGAPAAPRALDAAPAQSHPVAPPPSVVPAAPRDVAPVLAPPTTLTEPASSTHMWDADLAGYSPPSGAFGWVRYDGMVDVYALSPTVLACLGGRGEARVRFAVDVGPGDKRSVRLVSTEGPESVTRCLYQRGQRETAGRLGESGIVDVVAIAR